mmetsp:Transcript_62411/g.123338  ORF Transcript_62411/g.123338 Transcript_62411/m.123338 type:complete len:234 (-) Transcript_62411:1617-2318(-)
MLHCCLLWRNVPKLLQGCTAAVLLEELCFWVAADAVARKAVATSHRPLSLPTVMHEEAEQGEAVPSMPCRCGYLRGGCTDLLVVFAALLPWQREAGPYHSPVDPQRQKWSPPRPATSGPMRGSHQAFADGFAQRVDLTAPGRNSAARAAQVEYFFVRADPCKSPAVLWHAHARSATCATLVSKLRGPQHKPTNPHHFHHPSRVLGHGPHCCRDERMNAARRQKLGTPTLQDAN